MQGRPTGVEPGETAGMVIIKNPPANDEVAQMDYYRRSLSSYLNYNGL